MDRIFGRLRRDIGSITTQAAIDSGTSFGASMTAAIGLAGIAELCAVCTVVAAAPICAIGAGTVFGGSMLVGAVRSIITDEACSTCGIPADKACKTCAEGKSPTAPNCTACTCSTCITGKVLCKACTACKACTVCKKCTPCNGNICSGYDDDGDGDRTGRALGSLAVTSAVVCKFGRAIL
ncbi:hypothetical protein BDF19DRAFT_431807 [Syncephalis fuscata]|nr:hypothetical protein BDF19DRAFT_431807 [Syncephalis fuscata]